MSTHAKSQGTQTGMLARDAGVFFHQHGSSPCVDDLVAAEGAWLTTSSGARLLDLHGNSVHHIGHAHPRLIEAIKAQLDDLAFSPRRFANAPATKLAERLTQRFRGGASRLLLATGGSDAIEIAIRLARATTRRSALIALEGSYHGHGMGAFGLSSAHLDSRLGSQLPDIVHVTPYWDEAAGGAARMIADIESALTTTPGGIAALIAEPMRSTCIVPPAGLWAAVADLLRRHGTKLIFDEIPSGLGKTGRFFAHEHFDVVPDAVVLGKALGGGVLPIAAVLADDAWNVAPELSLGHYTHEKNPTTARAALTTLDIIEGEGLVARAASLGHYAQTEFEALRSEMPAGGLARMRGLGLLRVIELDFAIEPSRGLSPASRLVETARALGVSTSEKGAAAIGFSPPMTITQSEIDWALRQLSVSANGLLVRD